MSHQLLNNTHKLFRLFKQIRDSSQQVILAFDCKLLRKNVYEKKRVDYFIGIVQKCQ
jgi:hypothetical protein